LLRKFVLKKGTNRKIVLGGLLIQRKKKRTIRVSVKNENSILAFRIERGGFSVGGKGQDCGGGGRTIGRGRGKIVGKREELYRWKNGGSILVLVHEREGMGKGVSCGGVAVGRYGGNTNSKDAGEGQVE